ncbi:MAG: TolC family protein [Planctomycetota bacterium]
MSRRAALWGLLAANAVALGCAAPPRDGVWLLPAAGPDDVPPPTPLALEPTALGVPAAQAPLPWGPGQPLQLEHVLEAVETSYPLLTVAEWKRAVAQAQELQALGAFDLELSGKAQWNVEGFYENHTAGVGLEQATGLYGLRLRGGYRVGAGDFDLTWDGKRRINHGGEFSAGASLPLLRGGAIDPARRDLRVAEVAREVAAASLAERRLTYAQLAAAVYFEWVAAGRRRRIARALRQLADDRQRGLAEGFARGAIAEIEVLDNQRLVAEREALEVKARRELEKASLALSLFLRDPGGRPLLPDASALPGGLPPGPAPTAALLEEDVERALRARPDVQVAEHLLAQAQVVLDEAENQLLPTLDLTVLASQDLDRRRPSPTKGEFELVAGLEFGFPLQNRKARGKRAEAEAKLEVLRTELRFLRDQVTVEVRDAFSALQAAHEREARVRVAAELAERVSQAERDRFELGDSTVLRLNLREAAAAQAELKRVEALRDYWIAVGAYATALGATPRGPGLLP